MLGNIIEIVGNNVVVNLTIDITKQPNIVGLHTIFEDSNGKRIVGEITDVNRTTLNANIVGEFIDDRFSPGVTAKPSFTSIVRIANLDELRGLLGTEQTDNSNLFLGMSNIYENYRINLDINSFFSNHFAILGNSGSGKSYTVASMFQSLFHKENPPLGANIFMFDAYGEYTKAFSDIHGINNKLNYKVYTTDFQNETEQTPILKIPLWLMDVDDLALLLDVTTANQLPIIEKTLKLVPVLIGNSPIAVRLKNDIIARAIQDILLSGDESTKIRDQVTAVLSKFNTAELNLESKIVEPGYVRTLKQCLFIDKTGKMQEMELVTKFITTYIDDSLTLDIPSSTSFYTLKNLEEAMEFALISEGMLKSNRVYDMANVLLVRLHTLANSPSSVYFSYPTYVTKSQFIIDLMSIKHDNERMGNYNVGTVNSEKAQIVNFNISYVDDRLAKAITKILSRMLFTQALVMKKRGAMPFHIVIEEAHRYVLKDTDSEILGYNIFERITKEGRKYGTILGLITQRPSELSDTVVSQCNNFVVLKMSHPTDLNYIRTMVPNVSDEIIEKIKSLKPGNCLAFGQAFKIPLNVKVSTPNPPPLSNNVDMVGEWHNSSSINEQIILLDDRSTNVVVDSNQNTVNLMDASRPVNVQESVPDVNIVFDPSNNNGLGV